MPVIAVIFVLGTLIAFTPADHISSNKKLVDYHWFEVAPGEGNHDDYINSELSDYLGYGPTAPAGSCDGAGNNCIVGFTQDQVESASGSDYQLKIDSENPTQELAQVGDERTNP
ncbi:hypothetical protein U0035_14010 [Niabella yanshanensis]|uniref:Uncharacterized protein n=1 Tax=Niabella yanshanensis TaxID=577386 RepID=A0ABZ0W5I4_9BACT|nr:hypothetical protein [Niabella yanshanensis]WQD36782.1 hypothetical protein U0035_14010 [Niabella yanshanensis]